MCGITGYVGDRQGVRTVVDMLRRLEYRGYDSAGVAVAAPSDVTVIKSAGKLSALEAELHDHWNRVGTAIAHTRWATHGSPTTDNAHPHLSNDGAIALIHNGIIENHQELRRDLIAEGFVFHSETDTETLVHLVDRAFRTGLDLEAAIRHALGAVRGSYSIAVVSTHAPNTLFAAKTASPLILGLGDGENFLASDIPALMRYTRRVLVLEDGDFAVLGKEGVRISRLDGTPVIRDEFPITWDEQQAERGGYPHFLLKEIHEQPRALADTLRGRIQDDGLIRLDEVDAFTSERLQHFRRVQIVACGSAYNAGIVAKKFYEKLLRLPCEVTVASEFRYGEPIIDSETLCIVVSQSGETADTLAALREARRLGAAILAVVNVVGSSIAREADAVVYTQAGPEISVCSTKGYITQLMLLYQIGLHLAHTTGRQSAETIRAYVDGLVALPDAVEAVLADNIRIETLANQLAASSVFFFLGRGYDYATAHEGALKLKEISYLHAEAYAAGEMKHGPLALIEPGVVIFCLGTQTETFEKMLSNQQEVAARGGTVVAMTWEDETRADDTAFYTLRLPKVLPDFAPIVAIVPLQLLAYRIADARGCAIDQPRNLAKSVTVE